MKRSDDDQNPYLRDPDVRLMLRARDGDEAAFLQSCARRDTYWATVATMERDVLGHGSALSEAAPLGPLDDKPTV